MAKIFDPKKVLKRTSKALRQQLFTERFPLAGVPWDGLSETDVEPIFQAWQRLPDAERNDVQVLLQDFNDLSEERGLCVLAEEVRARCPDRAAEFAALEARCDRPLWVYLNVPDAFEKAALFARADTLAAGRYWVKRNSLPRQATAFTQELKKAVEVALTGYYWPTQMRGRYCFIEHLQRANGAEYFFAYLDDYPDKRFVYEDSGKMVRRSDRYAFTNVFVVNPNEGSLEMFAKGGWKVQEPLQAAFCKAMFGRDIDPADPLEPAYQLDHLLHPAYVFRTDAADRVAEAKIIRMRLFECDDPDQYFEVGVGPKCDAQAIHRKLARHLAGLDMPAAKFRVKHVTFRLTFMSDGQRRADTLTFHVAWPKHCDLKSKREGRREVGERCLKLWEVSRG